MKFKKRSYIPKREYGRLRGRRSEILVFHALFELQEEGSIKWFHYEDGVGKDFIVTLLSGKDIPLEVKTSQVHAREHQRKNPGIPVVVTEQNPVKAIKRKIKEKLNL